MPVVVESVRKTLPLIINPFFPDKFAPFSPRLMTVPIEVYTEVLLTLRVPFFGLVFRALFPPRAGTVGDSQAEDADHPPQSKR